MKIGLFTDTYYPQINGVATSVLMLKKYLERRGHQVYVFTTTDPNADSEEINVYRVPSIPFISARRVGMFYNPRLSKIIKRIGLDVIHTHTEFSLGIFGRAMARELSIPLLHTYHTIYEDYTHYLGKLGVFDPIAKMAVRKISINFCDSVDKVIVPTDKVKQLLLSYNVKQDISVIPTGIELTKFSKLNLNSYKIQKIRKSLGIEEKDKILLYIGRLAKEKNIEEILINLKFYLKDKENIKFLLIGDGPEKAILEEKAKELGIDKETIFAGERPWSDIGIYYHLGDVFISASQSETQGLTYIEALASGVPVVAKADKCLDGVIENNVNGYTFFTQDDFGNALDSILNNNLKKETLSIGALKSSKEFSAEHFANRMEELYIKMLSVDFYRYYIINS
ncbi:1,2-diacylglycerol 3-alpha-glucosyltransferase [Clostridium saccharoperbutylacetonicum]|uniref:1,2-diacylglycerol 3-glucosyltransferase n=1 Tax=Clostridium saccharoperbutylacetonicum N1-4(HMT) TaxID=931276 RepID=M1MLM5_9CLOT|nr:glycosyltransferase family 4 protein [Clostridium saccharoperbutylacetonicum]AGF55681.1 1,2-diacylglycerol 3-glucosyltransferase [Clostridium saccharoperbutylacetonicum N1-4(HMT)]NRT63593.1 1,2-diacylglycerol 3-alpha-glucosyltransferase [Clostridium saccharoperbutylacetonicum]NSB26956.1 1,2-diacylglycerol 3-alpha-glucosyltransferase [Clostridium saccharoperbutylacetonicum]NSB40440.1 1,2-diacylglycerol 3-alpha-glucosyltransferase [Clostridium saccharoperbutylacetonicum]